MGYRVMRCVEDGRGRRGEARCRMIGRGWDWEGRQARCVKVARSKLGKGELRSDAAGEDGKDVD